MKVTVNGTLIADTPGSPTLGGLSGSTDAQVQRADASVRERLIDRGSPSATLTVPTVVQFASVAEAEGWLVGFLRLGRYAGATVIETLDGVAHRWDMGVATLESFEMNGCALSLRWRLRLGDALT